MIIIINAMDVEHVMYDHIRYNWSHRNSNVSYVQSFGSRDGKTSSRFTTNSKVRTAVCRLKRGLWKWEQVPGREGLWLETDIPGL